MQNPRGGQFAPPTPGSRRSPANGRAPTSQRSPSNRALRGPAAEGNLPAATNLPAPSPNLEKVPLVTPNGHSPNKNGYGAPKGIKPRQRPSALMGKLFAVMLALCQAAVLAVAYVKTEGLSQGQDPHTSTAVNLASSQLYNNYIGVSLMMFIGFGYLMTFLRWYGVGAVGLTMLVTVLGVEVSLLCEPLLADTAKAVVVDMMGLLNANFAVAAFLISFGGLIGKVGPAQLVVLVVFECAAYCYNKQVLLTQKYDVATYDVGGTIVIHMFGAYFGLAASYVLGEPHNMEKETTSTVSDLMSLLGTVVLWVYWPSFVAGALPPGSAEANVALVNTVLSLLGSTITTFIVSPLLHKRGLIRPVDIQNATLAGGVSIGAVANLPLSPMVAMSIGSFAGIVSCVGFCKLQDFLHDTFKLHDTCGIHNLHGMPSLIGGFASVMGSSLVSMPASATAPPDTQFMGIVVTLGFSMLTGGFTGFVMKCFRDPAVRMADDSAHWEVSDDFEV